MLNRKTGGHALANPVGLGALLLIGVLLATGTDYAQYFTGGKFIQMLLGPATVALAVPLYANLHRLSRVFWPLLISLVLGSLVGIVSSAGVAWALGFARSCHARFPPPSPWGLPAKSAVRPNWQRCL